MTKTIALFVSLAFAAPASAQLAICDDIAAARKVFGAAPLMPETALSILNSAAWQNRPAWGLVASCPGCNGLELSNGRRVRLDRVIRRSDGMLFDVFTDGPENTPGKPIAPGISGPSCREDGDDERLFVDPVAPTAGGNPDPTPFPPTFPIEGFDVIVSLIGDFQADINRRIDSMPTKGDLEQLATKADLEAHDKKVDAKFEEARGWVDSLKNPRTWLLGGGLGALVAIIQALAGEAP